MRVIYFAVANLKVLSLLSNELFSDILRKPEEEVSKSDETAHQNIVTLFN